MLLTIFLAVVFCASITLMMIAAVAFIQDKKMFSSAPKEAQEVIIQRDKELFYGARNLGYVLMLFSIVMILGVFIISCWDAVRSGYSFWQTFARFMIILVIYKAYDMIFFDYYMLMKFHFFQYYFPEVEPVFENRKYGFNIVSQVVKLFIFFPIISAVLAEICSMLGTII